MYQSKAIYFNNANLALFNIENIFEMVNHFILYVFDLVKIDLILNDFFSFLLAASVYSRTHFPAVHLEIYFPLHSFFNKSKKYFNELQIN